MYRARILVAYLLAISLGLVLVSGNLDEFENNGSKEEEVENDPCAIVRCGFGASCQVVDGGAKCECSSFCPQVFMPFCASDGQTYGNECFARVAACNAKKPVPVKISDGPCPTKKRSSSRVQRQCNKQEN